MILCTGIAACAARPEEATAGRSEAAREGPHGFSHGNSVPAQPSATMAAPTPDPTLKSGMESEEVRALQQRLGELGYLNIDEYTIKFGPATERAVRLSNGRTGLRRTV